MDRRVVKTKNAILNAYIQLAQEKEVSKISVTEIAQTANIDRKTFYLHYESVEDIMEEMIENKLKELTALFESNGFYDEPTNIEIVFSSLNDLIGNDLPFYKKIAQNVSYDAFWLSVEEHLYETVVKVITERYEDAMKDTWICARFFASGIVEVYKKWLQDDHGVAIEELKDSTRKVAFLGIRAMIPENVDWYGHRFTL